MNAYKNNKINVKNTPYATVKNLRQNELKKGDLLLTSASEVPDECAVSAVIEDDIKKEYPDSQIIIHFEPSFKKV